MAYLSEGVQGLATHPPGGRVGGDGLRMCRLQLLQAAELVVVVVIRHGGLVQHIVLMARLDQLPAQGLDFGKIIHDSILLWTDIETFR